MKSRRAKRKGLGPEYGRQFQDQSVADAYPNRPPYPPQVFDTLLGLIRDESPLILDLGCGTGDIARGLAPHVAHVDAVDPSAAMIVRGQALPGGRHPNLNWISSTAEHFSYPGPYSLVVTAESLHWMDWYAVIPSIRRSLTPQGRLAIVLGRGFRNEPWATEMSQLIAQYSTNREYEPYDLLSELTERNLFVVEQRVQTDPVLFTHTLEVYVDSFHSRNGLSRERMGTRAEGFDAQLKAIIAQYRTGALLQFQVVADLAWGVP